MAQKLTNEEFINTMKTRKPTLIPLEDYINSSTSIKFKCSVCGNIFKNSPSRILGKRNQGCHKCYSNQKMTTDEDFRYKAKDNKNVTVIGEYFGQKNKIDVVCNHCGEVIKMRPDSILAGRGHLSCMEKLVCKIPTRTQEQFIKDIKAVNSDITPLGIYTRTVDKMNFRCEKCGCEWVSKVGHILHDGSGCPKCNLSKGEKRISYYLDNARINYISQHSFDDCKDNRKLPFDFFLPNINTCIEYDGEQHFKKVKFFKYSLEYIQSHDKIKNEYCKNNNIKLIRIPYTDFDNIEEILNKFIK